jgi:uncharacterized protein (DUF952 family)
MPHRDRTESVNTIYKVVSRQEWDDAAHSGTFHGSRDDQRDGYIHFSTAEQLPSTLEKYFKGQHDLVLLAFEAHALGDALKWEASRGGALFPHLYAPLKTGLMQSLEALECDVNGVPKIIAGDRGGC